MKIRTLKSYTKNLNLRVFIILLIIIQSCGINYFDGKGTFLIVIILFLCWKSFTKLRFNDFKFLSLILAFLFIDMFLNPAFQFSRMIYQYGLVLEVSLFLISYRSLGIEKITLDFYEALKIIFIQALVGYLLYLLVPDMFVPTKAFGYPYLHLFYCFFVTNNPGENHRNIGLLWEPGLLQLMLNLYLFFSIKFRRSLQLQLFIVATILSSFSTAGFITLGMNMIYFIVCNYKARRRLVLFVLILLVLASSTLVFVWDNIADKLGGENLSGLARYRDYLIGINLIQEKPWLGHGLFSSDYLLSKPYVSAIEMQLFSTEYNQTVGTLNGGYTNGLLGFFSWYGIPLSVYVFIKTFKNKIIPNHSLFERTIFFVIICFTLISEPITYTAFFLLFPFSNFVFSRRNIRKFKISNNQIMIPNRI